MSSNLLRTPPIHLILSTLFFAHLACGPDRIAPSPGSTKRVDETTVRRESASELIVAHVVAETGLRAGMPAAFPNVVSVQDWDDRDMPFAVVDGVPMTWYRRGDNTKPPATHDQYPRVRTLQGNWNYVANTVDRAVDAPPIATRVTIGGFDLGTVSDPFAFFDLPPVFVDGIVIPTPGRSRRPVRVGVFRVSVPAGDYQGFRGGPVGIRRGDGGVTAIGVVLEQCDASDDVTGERSILLAERLGNES